MPFTGSHPAAVLPLLGVRVLGTPLPVSALVIGSMSPDVPLYVNVLGVGTPQTHSTGGVFGVDLVFGLVIWLVWHGLLAAPALAGLPAVVRARLCGGVETGLAVRLRRGPRHLAAVVAALIVGALTHVCWDSFTHDSRWGSEHVGFLARTYGGATGADWAQLICSVLGLFAIGVVLVRRWTTQGAAAPRGGAAWALGRPAAAAWAAVALAAGVGAYDGLMTYLGSDGWRSLPLMVLTRAGAAAAVAALAVALAWHLVRFARQTDRTPTDRTPA